MFPKHTTKHPYKQRGGSYNCRSPTNGHHHNRAKNRDLQTFHQELFGWQFFSQASKACARWEVEKNVGTGPLPGFQWEIQVNVRDPEA